MRKLELVIGATGFQSRVKVDGEDIRARSLKLWVTHNDVTTVEIEALTIDSDPLTLTGLFVPEDDPFYESVRDLLLRLKQRPQKAPAEA